jgi:KDO2-lipid IV(A) lauroyltransferase
MGQLLYFLLIKPLSFVPLPVMYKVSNALSWFLYKVVKFRRDVIEGNIKRSFPEKPPEEQQYIIREYYRHLCDLIFEAIHSFSISEKELFSRCRVANPEIFEPYYEKGQSVIVCAGHYNNWEMVGTAFDRQILHQSVGLYKPLKNVFFDQKMKDSRSRFGLKMVSIRKVKEYFRDLDEPTVTLFATDQSPSNPKRAYWTTFLNQDTGVLFGTEAYAKKTNSPVLFGHITKVKRGHYDILFELITDDPSQLPEGAITETHTRLLEEEIRKAPQYWLWSHRRWKHKRPEEEVKGSANKSPSAQ